MADSLMSVMPWPDIQPLSNAIICRAAVHFIASVWDGMAGVHVSVLLAGYRVYLHECQVDLCNGRDFKVNLAGARLVNVVTQMGTAVRYIALP